MQERTALLEFQSSLVGHRSIYLVTRTFALLLFQPEVSPPGITRQIGRQSSNFYTDGSLSLRMCLIPRPLIWYSICHYYGQESLATMYRMTALPRALRSHSAFGICCLALTLSQGCARSEPASPTNAGSTGEQKLPFRPDADQAASSSGGAHPAVPSDPKSATGLPFRAASRPRILPSGTLLTVQLEDSLSTATVHAGDAFTASIAAPLTIDEDTLIERGTAVTGRVESAQSQADHPGLVPSSGYFRLTLNGIIVGGKQLALQTSSLFARGTVEPSHISSPGSLPDLRSPSLQVQKGHRLTFRLTAPVTLDDPNSMADRQTSGSISE